MNRICPLAAVALMLTAVPVAAETPGDHHHHAADEHPLASEAARAFAAENDVAMERMMREMSVPASGDVDHDFTQMMIPHHQGAIDMAVAVLRYGSNPQLRRLAQEIIVTQQQEIAAMRLAVGDPLPPSAAAPTQIPASR